MDKNKYKTKATSILKSLPVRMRWPEWMPDLIPVADVVMDDGALALAMSAARNAALPTGSGQRLAGDLLATRVAAERMQASLACFAP
jgi:hypothetical protein